MGSGPPSEVTPGEVTPAEVTPGPQIDLEGRPILEFQPAVDLASGMLLGFEALVRWDHPSRGPIAPSVLLPWAEANDRIVDLDAWVLAEACREAARWPSGIQVAANCSLTLLRRRLAATAAADALAQSGLPADRLTVEITEAAVADERAAEELRSLERLGVRLAVDDVGTSWSSLENLREFAIETAKVDRHFIASLEPEEGMNRAIVEAIVHIGHSLAMSTVAEGVETATQVAALRDMGADVAQGYFFSAPMAAAEARRLATAEQRAVFDLEGPGAHDTAPVASPRPLLLLPGDAGQAPAESSGQDTVAAPGA